MTDQQHPITIPPDLEEELLGLWPQEALQRAAQWGWQQRDASVAEELQKARDEELDGCCEWFVRDWTDIETADKLRAARRPKPPISAEQALATLQKLSTSDYPCNYQGDDDWDTLRRALESLPD